VTTSSPAVPEPRTPQQDADTVQMDEQLRRARPANAGRPSESSPQARAQRARQDLLGI
jgi:hypothetical protein